MSILTWLHLSDIHLRESDLYNSNVVLQSLLKDISENIQTHHLKPDFILVTGDIAAAGEAVEYTLAQQLFEDLLRVTGLSRESLFIVPGNHDVQRKAVSLVASRAHSILKTRDDVNRLLSDDGEQTLFFRRFQNYQQFVSAFFGQLMLSDAKHYVRFIEVAGCCIAIIGLNSAWMACSDEDRTRLLLGERAVRAAIDEARSSDLCIALMHHPFDWLQDFDRNHSEAMLCSNCHFILHGHMHRVGLLSARTPSADTMIIAAGASFESRDYRNSYNFVQLDLTQLSGTVYLRKYSDEEGGFWTKDGDRYKDAPEGTYSFPLPKAATFVDRIVERLMGDDVELRTVKNLSPKVVERLIAITQSDFHKRRLSPSVLHLRTENQKRAFLALSRIANENAVNYLKSLAPPDMVLIAASSFQIGSERFANESPMSEVWVNSFYLSRFPVTNNQYYEFIQSGGYSKEEYWTKNGWLWVQAYGRKRPLDWEDDLRHRERNHPVQWLTWYESMAYARWLALTTGAPYRLPTEIEWEKAASWDKEKSTKREYPWGNEFDYNCCNVKRTENAVSWSEPVGSRSPAGDSPYGVADMAGQVWEWVSSMRKSYPYDSADGREDAESEGERVFRGGSWANFGSYVARTTCRYYPHLVIMPYMNTTKGYNGPCGMRAALGFTGETVSVSSGT